MDGTWSTREIKEELQAARAQLWCFVVGSVRGIWVTRIEKTAKCTWGCVWGCAGDFQPYPTEAIALFSIIEDWLREQGCEFVEWTGREGWQRLFPEYRKHAVILRKRL